MNKEDLKKIIVHVFKCGWTHPAEVLADDIISQIPDYVDCLDEIENLKGVIEANIKQIKELLEENEQYLEDKK